MEAAARPLTRRFWHPQELFGPLSLQALENDQYVRQTTGYLPEASVAFIDEVRANMGASVICI